MAQAAEIQERAPCRQIRQWTRVRIHHAQHADGHAVRCPERRAGEKADSRASPIPVRRKGESRKGWISRASATRRSPPVGWSGRKTSPFSGSPSSSRPWRAMNRTRSDFDETHRAERRVEHLGGEPGKPTQNIARLRVDEVEPAQRRQPPALVRAAMIVAAQVSPVHPPRPALRKLGISLLPFSRVTKSFLWRYYLSSNDFLRGSGGAFFRHSLSRR